MSAPSSANSPTSISAERREWFAEFGYTGNTDEWVALRTVHDDTLGHATANDVWRVRPALIKFNRRDNIMFRRVVSAAEEGYRPTDRDRIFAEEANGSLTHPQTGEFMPGIANIVRALVDVDTDEMDGRFALTPLVATRKENRAAA